MRDTLRPSPLDLRKRAAAARAAARTTKVWEAEARAAVVGSFWRVHSVWVDQTSQAWCAEFVNASNGKSRFLTLPSGGDSLDRKTAILKQLS
jgi:hypothetical protein